MTTQLTDPLQYPSTGAKAEAFWGWAIPGARVKRIAKIRVGDDM